MAEYITGLYGLPLMDKEARKKLEEHSSQFITIANQFSNEIVDNNFILKYGEKEIAKIPLNNTNSEQTTQDNITTENGIMTILELAKEPTQSENELLIV